MSKQKVKKSWDVSKAMRDAVVTTAEHVHTLGEEAADFGAGVRKGFNEGIAEVKKRRAEKE